MAKLTILDNEFATMWYYTDTKIIHHQIKKYIYGAHLQELLEKGTETVLKYNAHKWLADDRNNNALTLQDQEWFNDIWLPVTAKFGWKFWAVVQPEKILGQLNMKRHAKHATNEGVSTATFTSPDEAMNWLVNQNMEYITYLGLSYKLCI